VTTPNIRADALAAFHAGLNVWRPKSDGSKAPFAPDGWAEYQTRRVTLDQVEAMYGNGCTGLGFFTGPVSGNTEVLDFDERDIYAKFKGRAQEAGLTEVLERIEAGFYETTPHGVHLAYHCTAVDGNTKLAKRPKRPEEMKDLNDKVATVIETRGTGGYIICSPTFGAVNPAGAYALVRGGFASMATITPEERDALFTVARGFDEMPRPVFSEPVARRTTGQSTEWAIRPGDDFGVRADWREVLEPVGWRLHHSRGDEDFWIRPGKTLGWSATTKVVDGKNLLYVFSSSTNLDSNRAYGLFAAYAALHHNGDFKAAAAKLADQGYGKQAETSGSHRVDPVTGEVLAELPEIDAAEQDGRIITPLAWRALERANSPSPRLFRHGGIPVRLERDDQKRLVTREVTADRMSHELVRAAEFFLFKKIKEEMVRKVVWPPKEVVKDVLATPDPPLPVVTRIVECPTFAPDGTLQTTTGYHAASQTYCAPPPNLRLLDVPTRPTAAEVERARALILGEVLADFPFVQQADRANAVGLGLLPFVRDMIAGPTPLHMAESPTPGTGKGLLISALLMPSCGRNIGAIPQCKDDDEWRKRITSLLKDGRPAVQIDNINRPLESGSLAMALTIPDWTERVLGLTSTISLAVRCAWVASGNNPTLSTEMARRTTRLRIDPRVDQPWDRDGWRHDELLVWVEQHRAELIWAYLTLARSWIAAGKPRFTGRALGSYEHWSHVIGGILDHVGIPGFLANAREFYETADTETAIWREFVTSWWARHADKEVGSADLFPLALATEGLELGKGTTERSQQIVFGKALARQRDRVIGGYRVSRPRVDHKVSRWQLLPAVSGGYVGDVGVCFDSEPRARACNESLTPHTQNGTGRKTYPDIPQHTPLSDESHPERVELVL
jgi:hypothetical protein